MRGARHYELGKTGIKMNYWVCKGRASNQFSSSLRSGRVARWHSAALPKKLSRGDLIFLWESTPYCRLIGLSRVHKTDCGVDKDGDHLFEQRYLTRRLPSPLGMEELRKVPIVSAAAFLKAGPSMLLTSLTQEQAEILLSLVHHRNQSELPKGLQPSSDLDWILPAVVASLVTANEGGMKLGVHYFRERDTNVIRLKREAVLTATGRLSCEVCGFDFEARYGPVGKGFCEVHHKKPLGMLEAEAKAATKLTDLAIVCSNCHRMIHRRSLKSLAALRGKLREV